MARIPQKKQAPDIVIIDDDPLVRSFLSDLLLQRWYTIGAFADGQSALDYLLQHSPPKLILMDLEMVGMNGWQFRERQRQIPELAQIPVVIMSGLDTSPIMLQRLEAVEYFQKPFDVPRLLALIDRYVRG